MPFQLTAPLNYRIMTFVFFMQHAQKSHLFFV